MVIEIDIDLLSMKDIKEGQRVFFSVAFSILLPTRGSHSISNFVPLVNKLNMPDI